MKRFYQFLSLFLLSLVGITQAVAQDYEQGDLLTDMNDIVGKQVLVYCPGGVSWDHPAGFMNGTKTVTSTIGADNIYTFEAVDGTTADGGHQLYILKQVSTGLYYKEPLWGSDDDDTPVEMTANANEAFKFASLPFTEYVSDGFKLTADNWRTAATPDKQDLSQEGFVFSRYELPTNWEAAYLGSIGTPFWSPYVDTNVWLVYSFSTLSGTEKLSQYLDYYFPSGTDALSHGINPGQYTEEAWKAADDAYKAAWNLLSGSHTSAEIDAACEALEKAYNALQDAIVPLSAGYYMIRDSRDAKNYLYTRTLNGAELIGSGSYTANDPLTADDAKYIWYVAPTDAENNFTIKNFYSESYITGQKTDGKFNLGKQASIGVAMEGQVETPSFLIYVPQDNATDHSQQLNTSNGYIVSWNSHPGDAGNCFHFETIAQSVIDALESSIRQDALNERLQKVYDEAIATKSANDGSLGLVTDAANLSSNATCTSEGKLDYLIDNSYAVGSYFHTDWTGSNDPDEYHYLQADLGNAVKSIKLTYAQRWRAENRRPGNQPQTINVYVTNDANGEWTDLGPMEMTYTQPVDFVKTDGTIDAVENAAGELNVDFGGTAYRYFRFAVLGTLAGDAQETTSKGHPFWYLGELHFVSNEAGASSNYDMVDATIRQTFEAQLQAASEAIAAGNATAEGIEALQKAYDALVNNLPDPARITALANTAKEAIKNAAVGEDPGYYPQSAIDALNTAVAAAEAVAKPGLSLAQVNEEAAKMQAAIDAFQNALILPAAGQYYFLRSASEKPNWQTNTGYNSKRAAIYSRDNAISGAVRFTMPENGYAAEGELSDSVNLYGNVKYLWYVEKSGDRKLVIRNVGTGMYLSNHTSQNNAAMAQSTEPEELTVGYSKAGAFYIQIGDGIYANAQLGGAMVAWSDSSDDNGSITFEATSKSLFADADYWWTVTRGGWQILTLPVSVDISDGAGGEAYTLVGQSDDNKLVLSKITHADAGTPFIFKADADVEDDNHLPNAYFETSEGALGDLDGNFTYEFTPKSVNGLTGTVAVADTCYKDRAYFSGGELRFTRTGKAAIGNNSGYFNGTHATGVTAAGDATLDLPENVVINGITDVVVLPETVDVYTLGGVLVRKGVKSANAVNGLPAGIYVVGGQKVLVK